MSGERARSGDVDPAGPATRHLARLARFSALHGEVRFVGYRDAERLVEKLAVALRDAIPAADLAAARFAGIPRGGTIVLGLLAYALDLSPDRLRDDDPSRPLVLVDDCALSGARLRSELAGRPGSRRIVVAHLLSSPALRVAIGADEPRVLACVAAEDLADRSAEVVADGAERAAWRERWRRRLGGRPYWFGAVEPVVFSWGEPDVVAGDASGGEIVGGWHLASPERCFELRMQLAGPQAERRVRSWRAPASVVHAEEGSRLWLFDRRRQEAFSLDGVGARAWLLLAAVGDLDFVVERLAAAYEVGTGELRRDLEALVAELVDRHLLEPAAASPGDDAAG